MKLRNSNLNETAVKSLSTFTAVFVTVLALSVSALAVNTNSEAMSLANLLTEEKDVESDVEEWMLNTNNFYFDYTFDEAAETALELESWMLNESNFESNFNLETEAEESLNVEIWMLNDSFFSKKDKTKAKEKSDSINENKALAEVKTDSKNNAVGVTSQKTQFGRRAMILVEVEDPKLKMEQWMLDYRHWNVK
jgi:hypothetical protein